jgi:methyl-accepting chemotaxis protein
MLKNMNIGKKLITTFISVAIISSIAGIVGLLVMTNMNASYSKALTDYGFSQGDVGRFNAEFAVSRSNLKDLLIYSDSKSIEDAIQSVNSSNTKLNQYIANLQKTMINEKEMGSYTIIKDEFAKYVESEAKVMELGKQNKKTEAASVLESEAAPHSDKVKAAVAALIDEKTTTGNQLSSSLTSQGTIAGVSILALILVALIASFAIAFGISRSISKPVSEMAEAAKKMAKGDLNVEIHADNSKNEIAQLSTAFAETVATLKTYIADLSG